MKKFYTPIISNTLKVIALLMLNSSAFAQPATSLTADPSAVSIIQDNSSTDIISTAILVFKFKNNAAILDATGIIPANSIRLTITFPATCAYTSVNTISNFSVVSADDQPNGVVILQNSAVINPQQVIDVKLNVRGIGTGSGNITYNVSVIASGSGNFLATNDNITASFNTATVLPVKLKSFTATTNNCTNKFNWQSTSEINLKSYSLEYSNDGNKYSSLYSIKAEGNNAKYSTTHDAAGKSYYRLKMIDLDGTYEYSQIITLDNNCDKNRVFVYPNPASEFLNINITGNSSQITRATLYDAGGKVMLQQNFKPGVNAMKVNTLARGTYTLHLNADGVVETIQVLIK